MIIEKYTLGMGDRFAHQGEAQLRAIMQGRDKGLHVHPVWNKSNREHTIVKSKPADLRTEADAAVRALGWDAPYYVDADHINLNTVDSFLECSNFFTLDVADSVGKTPESGDVDRFGKFMSRWNGRAAIPGLARELVLDADTMSAAAGKFLAAMIEAGKIHRHITAKIGADFVTEISVDETDTPQTPAELFLILAMLAMENVPAQTIAPKFTGRFNKGVDYVGDLAQFEKEFDEDLHVIAFVVKEFGLPGSLKLSVHSGSDKFSLYPVINKLVKKHGCGLHVKTAGTTWLEEVIGLAEAGGGGLEIARDIYAGARGRFEELTGPYATVIDIDPSRLPSPEDVRRWDSQTYVRVLRHDPACSDYNSHFRQLIHVAFKVAAEMGPRYRDALVEHRTIVARNVTDNLLNRHLLPVFG